MKQICRYCNGLEALEICCPACDGQLQDCGTLQEALGPYAPYEENSMVHAQFDCAHQVYCPNCNIEYLYSVPD
ncbi:hypothetical protein [Dethiobacter alkaliphilus]|uniref:hypothetical protein n=1 Tax=Dethiobacter alkaliphilus TaxID=427926 RepID=UPI0002EDAD71|nr:hypothetical protein [Dethiobacter alkaliphilus]